MSNEQNQRPIPGFFVGKEVASKRIARFMRDKHPVLTKQLGREDTKSIWYSFRHIEELYEELKHLNADGLRIYLAAYTEEDNEALQGHTCLIMVPTEAASPDRNVDIVLEEKTDHELRMLGYIKWEEEPTGGSFIKGIRPQQEKAFNVGRPSPPAPSAAEDVRYP